MIYGFPWRVLWLVEFVFALVAARLGLFGYGGFSFYVDRGFIGFGFRQIPSTLNFCGALGFSFFLAH